MKSDCPYCKRGNKSFVNHFEWECDNCHLKGDDREDYSVLGTGYSNRPKTPYGFSPPKKNPNPHQELLDYINDNKIKPSQNLCGNNQFIQEYESAFANADVCKRLDTLTNISLENKNGQWVSTWALSQIPIADTQHLISGYISLGPNNIYQIVIDGNHSQFKKIFQPQQQKIPQVTKATLSPLHQTLEIVWDEQPKGFTVVLNYYSKNKKQCMWAYDGIPFVSHSDDEMAVYATAKSMFGPLLDPNKLKFLGNNY